MVFAPAGIVWLGGNRKWSRLREVWREGLAVSVFLGFVAGFWWFHHLLPAAQQVIIAGVLLIALAVLLRHGWLRLFGPVLFYDLVRLARRKRSFLLRFLYAAALLVLLVWLFSNFDPPVRNWTGPAFGNIDPLPYHPAAGELVRMSRFAEAFFYPFICGQLLLVFLLTPAYTAGAIAEEKEKKTLDFLLATDLRDREIVLGKMVSRSIHLAFLLLAGLPIVSFTQFWGGIDPNLVMAGFAATGLTLASLAGLSILNSVYARKSRDAIILTYLVSGAYLGLSLLSRALLASPAPAAALAAVPPTTNPDPIGLCVDWLGAGNPASAVLRLRETLNAGKPLSSAIPGLLLQYAVFHGLVAAVCASLAVMRLRSVALNPVSAKRVRVPFTRRTRKRRPMGESPILWKEVFVERAMTFNWFGRAIVALIILASFLPAIWIGGAMFLHTINGTLGSDTAYGSYAPYRSSSYYWSTWEQLGFAINRWVRFVGAVVACLTLLGVAVRAASCVTSERERQTLDSLLTSPLESGPILFGKWLGAILSVRWAWLWLILIWGIGLATGGLNIVVIPWLFLAWTIYAAFVSSLGLYFSISKRSTLQATLWTLIVCLGLSFGHWLPWLVIGGIRAPSGLVNQDSASWLGTLQIYGLTPPVTLAWLSFRGGEFELEYISNMWENQWDNFVAIMWGLALWAMAAGILLRIARGRFRVVVGRTAREQSKIAIKEIQFALWSRQKILMLVLLFLVFVWSWVLWKF